MSGYFPLGARPAIVAADTTGLNSGNWTAMLDLSQIGVNSPSFECYHLYIESPQLDTGQTSAKVRINQYLWDATLIGQLNSWDPAQPMLVTPGDSIYIMFNVPTSVTPMPMVVCWFRESS